MDRNDGRVWYDSLQVSAQKRLTTTFSVTAAYTGSRTIEELNYRDPISRVMDRSPASTDRPHRLTASAVYSTGRSAREMGWLLEDWTIAGTFVAQSGRPWDLPSNISTYVGDAHLELSGGRYLQGVAPCVGEVGTTGEMTLLPAAVAWGCTEANFIIAGPFSERTAPFRTGRLRLPGFAQVDVSIARAIRVRGRTQAQIRVDALNVLNTPAYDERQYVSNPRNSEFGRINRDATAQSNFPRQLQLGLKLQF
jgi:hypothetical protein